MSHRPGPSRWRQTAEEEFELVVGRRQVAGIMFLALVVVAVCSGGSYLAGKAISALAWKPPSRRSRSSSHRSVRAGSRANSDAGCDARSDHRSRARLSPRRTLRCSPIRNPQAIYIQVGAVEKGVAVILAEGLRKHALDSFVAPGPTAENRFAC